MKNCIKTTEDLRDLPLMISVEDSAAIMGLSASTVRRMLVDEQLVGVKLRGKWMVSRDALLEICGLSTAVL